LSVIERERTTGIELLRRASSLNPRDPVVSATLDRAREGRPISLRGLDRAFVSRVCERIGRTEGTQFCP
jgi:hypothetical protein